MKTNDMNFIGSSSLKQNDSTATRGLWTILMQIGKYALCCFVTMISLHVDTTFAHHPHDVVSAIALSPSYNQDKTLLVASQGALDIFLISRDGGKTFFEAGAGLGGKDIRSIHFSPQWSTNGCAYVAVAEAGLFKTTNRAATWQKISHGTKVTLLSKLHSTPSGEDLFDFVENGSLKRLRGNRIENIEIQTRGAKITAVGLVPGSEDSIVALEDGRILFGLNNHQKWVKASVPKSITDILVSPDTDRVWFATGGSGVYVGDTSGGPINPLKPALPDPHVNALDSAMVNGRVKLLAATQNGGVFSLEENDSNWRDLRLQTIRTKQTKNMYRLVRSHSGGDQVSIACGTFAGLFLSTDGGEHWNEALINPTRMGRLVTFSPRKADSLLALSAGYGMHIMYSRDAGKSWIHRNTGLGAAGSIYSLAVSPGKYSERLLIAGVNEGIRLSDDEGLSWKAINLPRHPSKINLGSGMMEIAFSPDFDKDGVLFVLGMRGVLYRSSDRGKTWTMVKIPSDWASALTLSPDFEKDHTLWVGGFKVFKSIDGGNSFSEPLFHGMINPGSLLYSQASSQQRVIFALSPINGVVRFSDNGKHVYANNGLSGHKPIAITKTTNGDLFVTTAGGGIFVSKDTAKGWKRITNEPSPVSRGYAIAVDSSSNSMLVGTFNGLYRSSDGGKSWLQSTSSEMYDEHRDPWHREGRWQRIKDSKAINGTFLQAKEEGAKMTLPFSGKGVCLYGTVGPLHGDLEISLDGKIHGIVSARRMRPRQQVQLVTINNLPAGYHVLEARVCNLPTQHSIGIDGAEVFY